MIHETTVLIKTGIIGQEQIFFICIVKHWNFFEIKASNKLTSRPNVGECSSSRSDYFIFTKRESGSHCIGGCVEPGIFWTRLLRGMIQNVLRGNVAQTRQFHILLLHWAVRLLGTVMDMKAFSLIVLKVVNINTVVFWHLTVNTGRYL
jgi:hypothetical protein